MNENSLNSKLNRVEMVTKDLRIKLKLDNSAVIEDVIEATNLAALANVFIQEEEPNIKDGIWIKANKEENSWDKIIMDREMIVPYKWQLLNQTPRLQQKTFNGVSSHSTLVAPDSYTIANGRLCKYSGGFYAYTLANKDGIGNKYQQWAVTTHVNDCVTSDGTNAYISLGGYSAMYAFNIATGAEVDGYPDVNSGNRNLRYNAYDNSLYACYGSYLVQKIDLTTKTRKDIWTNNSSKPKITKLLPLGEKLLCIASEPGKSFMIDLANSYRKVENAPEAIQNLYVPDEQGWGLLDMPDHFYIYKGLESVVKYNKDTLEAEDMTAVFQDNEIVNLYSLLYYNNQFYCVHGPSSGELYLAPMSTTGKVYNDNAVLISQAPISKTEHQTALWTYDGLEGRMTQSFYDIFYYNKEKGFMKEYPIYYGNGTEWIKFKN